MTRRSLTQRLPNIAHSHARYLRNWCHRLSVEFAPKRKLGSRPVFSGLVVSLTTFPPRVRQCAVAIESIFQQSVHPSAVLLALATEEFPGRRIPRSLRGLVKRGLTIVWVDVNHKSYDKLLSARVKFPDHTIITIDDDKILNPLFLEEMMEAHTKNPDCVIGYRGWEMRLVDGALRYGHGWVRADETTPSMQLFLPGNAGILYPTGSIGEKLYEMEIAYSLSPTADDFWFWGLTHESSSKLICLGKPPHVPIVSLKRSPALRDVNEFTNDDQFQKTIDHFGLRERLVKECSGRELHSCS